MTAGLPGTGIGGLFYMLLVLLMPLRELWRTLQGRGSVERWKDVAVHWALAAGILGALAAGGWLLREAVDALTRLGVLSEPLRQIALNAGTVTSTVALLVAGAVLLAVVGGAALLGLLARPAPPPPA